MSKKPTTTIVAKDVKERILLQKELIERTKSKILKLQKALLDHEKGLQKLHIELDYQKHSKELDDLLK